MAGISFGGMVISCLDDQFQVNLAQFNKHEQFTQISAAYWRYRQKICKEQVEPALKGTMDPNNEAYLEEVGKRVQSAMNRKLANTHGGLSAEGIEEILQCMDKGVQVDRKKLAAQLAVVLEQPKKAEPKEQKNDALLDKTTQANAQPKPALNKAKSVEPNRATELVQKVNQKDQKLAQFIQDILTRHLKEYVVPMMDESTPESSHVDMRSVTVAWKAREYVNNLIYNSRDTQFLGKKGFNVVMIVALLNTYKGKMKEEGSQDPYSSWTGQQFTETLQKILN